MERISENEFKLSTGKVIVANNGILGITENNPTLIYEGYDGYLATEKFEPDPEEVDLTNEEVKELADYMVNLWKRWSENYLALNDDK